MHRTFAVVVCAVLLAACRPAQSVGDELDDLLAAQPSAAQSESAPKATAHDHTNHPLSDGPDFADQSRWHPTVAPAAPHPSANSSSTSAPTHKPAPSSPFNAVPEPSAVALAALALFYFLVFGRRRHVG